MAGIETSSQVISRLESKVSENVKHVLLEDSYILWENHLLSIYIKSPFMEEMFKTDKILKPRQKPSESQWTYNKVGYLTGTLDTVGHFYHEWGYSNVLEQYQLINPYIFATVGIKDGMLFQTGHFSNNPKDTVSKIANNVVDNAKSIYKMYNTAIFYKIDCTMSVVDLTSK